MTKQRMYSIVIAGLLFSGTVFASSAVGENEELLHELQEASGKPVSSQEKQNCHQQICKK